MALNDELKKQQERLRQLREDRFVNRVIKTAQEPIDRLFVKITGIFNTLIDYAKDNKKEIAEVKTVVKKINNRDVIEKVNVLEETIKKKDFRGPKGDPGKDGKSIKGKDGYAPKKGEDYFDGKDGKPGIDGKDGRSIRGDKGDSGEDGSDGSPDTPKEIRDKLQTLRGEERLSAKYIKDLQRFVSTVYQGTKKFVGLVDTPNSYAEAEGKIVAVNSEGTGLEFITNDVGDITSVIAGDGLTGGGDSGAVTLALDADYTDGLYLKLDASNDPVTGQLNIEVDTTTQSALVLQTTDDDATQNLFNACKADGTTSLMALTADGKVGIGTDSPTTILNATGTDLAYNQPVLLIEKKYTEISAGQPYMALFKNDSEIAGGSDFQNEAHIALQAGTSANHRRYIHFNDYDGTPKFRTGVNGGGRWILYDSQGTHRTHLIPGGDTNFNSSGAGAVIINNYLAEAGTGGFKVYSGGASPTLVFDIDTANSLTTNYGQFKVDGGVDGVQTIFQGHSAQANNITEWQNSGGTRLSSISGLGRLGIGIDASSVYDIRLNRNISDLSGTYYSMRSLLTSVAAAGNSTATLNGYKIDVESWSGAANNHGSLIALNGAVSHRGAGTMTAATGLNFAIQNTTTGTITTASSIVVDIDNNSTGTITTANGIQIKNFLNASGTITTASGLYIEDMNTATTNYAIYTNAGLNQLGDQLKIIGNTNTQQLVVKANTTQTANIFEIQDGNGVVNALMTKDGAAAFGAASLPANTFVYVDSGAINRMFTVKSDNGRMDYETTSGLNKLTSYNTGATGYQDFEIFVAGSRTSFHLDKNNGYLGVGSNATPQGLLHVKGLADDQQLIVQANSTQTANLTELRNSSNSTRRAFNAVGIDILIADQTTDTAPNDDTTLKKMSLQKLASPPTNAAYIAFANNPGTDTFYLVLEEG